MKVLHRYLEIDAEAGAKDPGGAADKASDKARN